MTASTLIHPPRGAIAFLGATSFVASGVWYALVARSITVSPRPTFAAGQSFDERLGVYYDWFATTVRQERFYGALSILAFACLAATVVQVRRRTSDALASGAVVLGAVLWIVGTVVQLGGDQAVARLTARGDAIESVDSLAITVGKLNDAFELASLLAVGAGLLLLDRGVFPGRLWRRLSTVTGALALATAAAYAADAFWLVDALLVASGALVVPAWLVTTGVHIVKRGSPEPPSTPQQAVARSRP